MFSKIRDKIAKRSKESELVRRVYISIFNSYEKEWNLQARSRRSAIYSILNVKDKETFDKRGGVCRGT